MFVLASVLVSVALVAAIALVLITTVLSREMRRVATEDARLQASLRTKVELLGYARASDWAVSARSVGAHKGRSDAESGLRSAMAEMRRLGASERIDELDGVTRAADSYVEGRGRLEREGLPLGIVIERSTPSLQAVFNNLDSLIAADDDAVVFAESSARAWHGVANVIGISAGALLLVGFAFAMVGTTLLVHRPLLATTRAIARYAEGDESVRPVPSGAHELRQMTTTFNDLADRLARQGQDRLAFLGGVVHDLRNPLSALKMAMDILRCKQCASPEQVAKTLAIVGRQIARLERMAGDLLDSTRIESGRLELRPETLDLRPIVGHVVELYRSVSPGHEIVCLQPDASVVLECDPTRIEQVLTNLVSNAIKYSPEGGRVIVAVFVEPTAAVVTVSDEGIGILPDEHERIFEPFHRAARSRDLLPGIGLGLSVARKIVVAHRGRLEVESRVGFGSTFRVRLPLSTIEYLGAPD